MKFEECIKDYPIHDTLVGDYSMQWVYTLDEARNLRNSYNPPLEWGSDCAYSFLVYDEEQNTFSSWCYAFFRVSGYLSKDPSFDDIIPALNDDGNWEELGDWEEPLLPDEELAKEFGWPLDEYKNDFWRQEQAAYEFDPEAYKAGHIFTTYDALERFIKEME